MIVSAALRFETADGKQHVMPVHRHGDGFAIIAEFNIPYIRSSVEQGFINSAYRDMKYEYEFVDRREAMRIARACGQLKEPADTYGELFSEDLW